MVYVDSSGWGEGANRWFGRRGGERRYHGDTVNLLETRNVSIHFGGLKAVDGVDFFVREGEILSLIGPNGAGKTTLFNLVSGFLTPLAGTVHYAGREITGLPPYTIARDGIVRTFQKTNIFSEITVREGIATGFHIRRNTGLWSILVNGDEAREEQRRVALWASEILEFTGLTPWAETLGKNLPYGKQRLLEIGVALAATPRLLLLDEPATGLNPKETQDLMALIRRIRDEKRITVLLIEHNMNVVVGISDRVIVLNHGQKIADGTPSEISRDRAVIEAYMGSGATYAQGQPD
jgi:branched-chain amino acid transport system ATP-binding protein